jgi:hypothetical protein
MKYKFVKRFLKNKKEEDQRIVIKLTKETDFPGVMIEFHGIRLIDKKEDQEEQKGNCEIKYEILKVPTGKYQDMDEQYKEKFEQTIKDTFSELFKQLMKTIQIDNTFKEKTENDG